MTMVIFAPGWAWEETNALTQQHANRRLLKEE
jgi:hypothetical protein